MADNLSLVGHLNEFNFNLSNWELYSARLKNYLVANKITDPTLKRAILLNTLSEESYKLMYDLCNPVKPEDKTFDALITTFDEQFKPIKSTYVARLKFYNARKSSSESITEWIARVRSLATKCEFTADQLKLVLNDIFVVGLESGPIRDRLFEEDATKLDLAKAMKLAQNKESARQHMEPGLVSVKSEAVHKLRPVQRKIGGQPAKGKEMVPMKNRQDNSCFVCGRRGHFASKCIYKDANCHICGMKGHLATVCSKKKNNFKDNKHCKNNYLERNDLEVLPFYAFSESNYKYVKPYFVMLKVENQNIKFEIDTGTAISVMSYKLWKQKFSHIKLNKSDCVLNDYVGVKIKPIGFLSLNVTYKKESILLDMFVVQNGGPPLLGRVGLNKLNLGISEVNESGRTELLHHIAIETQLEELCKKYSSLLNDKLGTFKNGTIKLILKDNVLPKYYNARPLAFKVKEKVSLEIDRLTKEGILVPVEYSEWGTPVVPIWKPDGSIRLCGDFKITLNPALKVFKYPIPRIEDLFVQLQGGVKFSKIDLSQAYNQLLLDDESRELCTISTHKGLFQYTRLPYGIVSAPAIFEKLIESVMSGIEGVVCFFDDILVTAETDEKHIERLEIVFSRLLKAGLTIKKDKCCFMQDRVTYLGHTIDKVGLHTSNDKIEAIKKISSPLNVTQLKSFLGMVNYYCKFIKDLAIILHPLYNLTKRDVKFVWTKQCEAALQKTKEMLVSAPVLVHFNPNLPLKLTVDASSKGLGGILTHIFPDKTEKPVAYISRVLSKSEQNYSQIDKEALAIIWAVKKFHQYLYCNKFTLFTDHKPLVSIFGEKKGLPQLAASRMQRWAYILSAYNYDIQYIQSKQNNADCLSRINENDDTDIDTNIIEDCSYINYIQDNSNINIDFHKIRNEVRKDVTLSKVMQFVKRGWPDCKVSNFQESLQPYAIRKNELSVQQGCLLWGYRVIVPDKYRNIILNELHASHMGIVKMKGLARSYVWWPSINKDIEHIASNCKSCNKNRDLPECCLLSPWEWPKEPWTRVHIDYLGPFLGYNFLVLVDAHSKWIECDAVKSTTSSETIEKLREIFARFGLPKQVVSDNARVFTSSEFQEYLNKNGIQHLTGPPYHPSSNGLAENAVKQIKNCMLNVVGRSSCNLALLKMIISRFLFDYRNTVHTVTGESPAKLLIGKNLRTRFDLLLPSTTDVVYKKQCKQINLCGGKNESEFEIGKQILVRDYRNLNKVSWCDGVIIEKIGSRLYLVKTVDGHVWKRHKDQLKNLERYSNNIVYNGYSDGFDESVETNTNESPSKENLTPTEVVNIESSVDRPRRVVKPPDRYQAGN